MVKTFTRLLLLDVVTLTSAFFAHQKGLFETVIEHDVSYISSVIVLLYVGMSVFAANLAKKLDSKTLPLSADDSLFFEKKLDFSWFVSSHFFNLGLMGTIIGFCYSMGASLNPGADANKIVLDLKTGTSTLMFTTLFGLVASVLLQIQTYIIQYKVK